MTNNNIEILRKGNIEDFCNYGLYLLRFKHKIYIGCAYDETIESRRQGHISKSINGTTPKDKQLREEGGCSMEVLYKLPNARCSAAKRKKLIKQLESYLIYKSGHSILEQLLDINVVDENLGAYKEIISNYMLNSQY